MINLITSFYLPPQADRKAEIIKCLNKNLENSDIVKIHLFLDNDECFNFIKTGTNNDKITIIAIGKQPLYSDLIKYANTLTGQICMISNSDIWLNQISDKHLLEMLRNKNIVYDLTRKEHDFSCPLINKYEGSHDVFIFESPLNDQIIKHVQFVQNVDGSENVMIYELAKYGYKLYNPCKQIVIIHEHESNLRDPNRKRINIGGLDGDNIYRLRSDMIKPSEIKISPNNNIMINVVSTCLWGSDSKYTIGA